MNVILDQSYSAKRQVVILEMQSLFFKNYTYMIINHETNEAVVVDPAWEMKKIEEVLTQHEVKLIGILITHTHIDHVDLVKPLIKKYNCPSWVSKTEYDNGRFRCDGLSCFDSDLPFFCGSIPVKPILTPGHSPGGTCYLIDENLFTGDTLFTEGCGYCFGSNENASQMFHSLQKLKKQIASGTKIFPGHSYGKFPGKSFAEILDQNMYLQIENETDFVKYRNRSGQKNLFKFQWAKK